VSAPALPPGSPPESRLPGDTAPKPRLLLLGTFHFKDAGLDGYKPKHAFGALTEKRQAEIADIVARLAAFQPTRVALEIEDQQSALINERYTKFLAGEFSISDRENEIYQIGFRVAQAAGLKRLDCVDVKGRTFPDTPKTIEELRAYAKSRGEERWLDGKITAPFTRLYEQDDEQKTRLTLRDTLVYLNSETRLLKGHGHYLADTFRVGAGDKYHGADDLAAYWYARNLRIFANLLRLSENPDERILVIIGAGHVPIIRHAALASPDVELVEVAAILGKN